MTQNHLLSKYVLPAHKIFGVSKGTLPISKPERPKGSKTKKSDVTQSLMEKSQRGRKRHTEALTGWVDVDPNGKYIAMKQPRQADSGDEFASITSLAMEAQALHRLAE